MFQIVHFQKIMMKIIKLKQVDHSTYISFLIIPSWQETNESLGSVTNDQSKLKKNVWSTDSFSPPSCSCQAWTRCRAHWWCRWPLSRGRSPGATGTLSSISTEPHLSNPLELSQAAKPKWKTWSHTRVLFLVLWLIPLWLRRHQQALYTTVINWLADTASITEESIVQSCCCIRWQVSEFIS